MDRSLDDDEDVGLHWLLIVPLTTQDVFRIWSDRRYVLCWNARNGEKKEKAHDRRAAPALKPTKHTTR